MASCILSILDINSDQSVAPNESDSGDERHNFHHARVCAGHASPFGIRAGNFGCVVGVNRIDDEHVRALREQGADVVVHDLEEML